MAELATRLRLHHDLTTNRLMEFFKLCCSKCRSPNPSAVEMDSNHTFIRTGTPDSSFSFEKPLRASYILDEDVAF